MHIHGNSMNVEAVNFYSAAQQRRADAAQRAAEVRKKLLKGAAEVDDSVTPEEALLIGRWLNADESQHPSDDEYRSTSTGKDSDFG